MAAGPASLPAGGVPGHRHRQRPGRPADLVRPQALRRPARRPVRRPVAGRHVPPLAVLPAPPVVDQAVRARGADVARVPALRLEQPDRVRARAPLAPGPSTWTARRTSRRGRRWRRASPAFADQAGIAVRYDCRWERTRRDDGPDGTVFTLETTDGEYRCRNLVLAVGIAEPWSPSTPGIEHARHYAQTRDADVVRGQAAVHHRQAELRVRARVGAVVLGVEDHRRRRRRPPRPRSRPSRWSASGPATCSRSRTTSWASGCRSSTPRSTAIEPVGDGFRVNLKRTDNGEAMSVEADEVIAATGFTCPLQDLADLGVTTFGQAKLPSVTPMWESRDACPGSSSPARSARRRRASRSTASRPTPAPSRGTGTTGWSSPGTSRRRGSASRWTGRRSRPPTCWPYLLREATCAPELWHQKAYLGRVLSVSADDGIRDEGILPVVHALDGDDPGRDRDDGRGRRDRATCTRSSTSAAAAGSRSTRCPATRCSTSRRSAHGDGAPGRARRARPGLARDGAEPRRPGASARCRLIDSRAGSRYPTTRYAFSRYMAN